MALRSMETLGSRAGDFEASVKRESLCAWGICEGKYLILAWFDWIWEECVWHVEAMTFTEEPERSRVSPVST